MALRKKEYSKAILCELSLKALSNLEQTELFKDASCIAMYHALGDEVQTAGFIDKWKDDKQILLPIVEGDELILLPYKGKHALTTGKYGIYEPCRDADCYSNKHLPDLIVVPGVAFDRSRNRMGRGKGYYDRLLSGLDAPTCGLCFHFQLIDSIPTESFDIPMDRVVTDSEVI